MKRTILYIGGFELPDKNAAAHRVTSNGKIFEELGYLVKYRGLFNEKKSENIFDIKRPSNFVEWVTYSVGCKSIIDLINEDSSIVAVVLYNYPALAQARILSFCKKRNIKVISDCTEWYSVKNHKSLPMKIIKGLDTSFRMRVINKLSDGIIVISRFLEKYYDNQNTILLPPLVDTQDKKWLNSIERPKLNYDELIFTYAGSPGKDKDDINGIIDLLNQLNTSKTVILQVIGVKRDEVDISDENEIGIVKTNFIGKISHEDALKLISKSNYYIFVRKNNRVTNAGFPTKFVEGVTLGVPVITNDVSDIKSYMENYSVGTLLNATNKSDSKKILQNLIDKKITVGTDTKIFDYRNYKQIMKEFLNKTVKDDSIV